MNQKLTISLACLSFLVSCFAMKASPLQSQSSSSQGRTLGVPTVQDPDEYAVWSAVLSKEYGYRNLQRLVIKDRTALEVKPERLDKLEKGLAEMVPDLEGKNETKYALENKFGVRLPCVLISAETENRLFPFASITVLDREAVDKVQKSWHEFYQEYPGAQGVLTLSRVGFNSDKSQAVVYVTNHASPLIGAGELFLLAKKNGAWKILKVHPVWFS
jgi:hypothetical protein